MKLQIIVSLIVFKLSCCLMNLTNKKFTIPIIINSMSSKNKNNYKKNDNTTSVRIKKNNDPIFPLLPANVAFLLIE